MRLYLNCDKKISTGDAVSREFQPIKAVSWLRVPCAGVKPDSPTEQQGAVLINRDGANIFLAIPLSKEAG